MREQEAWEEKIKNVLDLECDGVTASRDLKDRIDRQILESQKEAGNKKKFSMKKLVIGVAAGCLLISGGVFATGHAVSLSTHSFLPNPTGVTVIWEKRKGSWAIRRIRWSRSQTDINSRG